MSLNLMCVICNEFYDKDDAVFSTSKCGHLFHHQCLRQWLMNSPTCPQCREPCTRQSIHRVYLNYGERTAEDDVAEKADVADDALRKHSLRWKLIETTETLPSDAIKCGTDWEGNDAYVARFFFQDDLLPAIYVPAKKIAYSSYGCSSQSTSEDIMLLVNCDYRWELAANGVVPENAIVTGHSELGENLYTGRTYYEGHMLGGKVHPSHGVLYMPYEQREVNSKEYEVLVVYEQNNQQRNVAVEANAGNSEGNSERNNAGNNVGNNLVSSTIVNWLD